MPAKRKLTMRQLRQMLRLARDGASSREIARVLGVARSTVQENLKRAADAGLSWPLPGELTDDALEQRLFARAGVKPGTPPSPGAQLGRAGHRSEEARRHHDGALGGIPGGPARRVRLQSLLRAVPRLRAPAAAEHAAGSRRRRQGLRRLLRQEDRRSSIRTPGEIREAEIFVAVLGASNFTYAEATWTQSLPDWIGAHVRMFRLLRRRAAPGRARQPEVRASTRPRSTTRSSTAATG